MKTPNILLFGGTTEGRKAAEVLDYLKLDYYYSVKADVHKEVKGIRVHGGFDSKEMEFFCREKEIKLLVDAAHPFAIELHKNVTNLADELDIPSIRFEREFPDISENEKLKLFNSHQELNTYLKSSSYQNILSLTGVQTIPHYKEIWKTRNCIFRILDTDLSRQKAKSYGIPESQIVSEAPKDDEERLLTLAKQMNAEVFLTKESGVSGQFETKLRVAEKLNIPLLVLQRPQLAAYQWYANLQKELLQVLLKQRKELFPVKELRSGLTSGSSVCAAANAALFHLLERKPQKYVSMQLPDESKANFMCFPEKESNDEIAYVVIKDGGDDPDVTHGEEMGCSVKLTEKEGIRIHKGKGIGTVTLPGLQVSVGEAAINPIPRKMLKQNLRQILAEFDYEGGLEVTPFVPNGEEIAKKTFNPRIGVKGGISIIGTTGRVFPLSSEAFLASIRQQIKQAVELGVEQLVFTSGKRSENILKPFHAELPEQAYIHFGNFVGKALKMAEELGIKSVHLGMMPGKAIKMAEGHLDTHSKKVVFNPGFAAQLALDCGYSEHIITEIKKLKLANAIENFIPYQAEELYYQELSRKAKETGESALSKMNLRFTLILKPEELIHL